MLEKIGYFVLVAVVAYCCGNFNGAIITSRYHYNSDVREQGSGNAGLTNFYRCYGKTRLLWVVFIDITKAVVAVLTGGLLMRDFGIPEVGQSVALLFVIAGHMFPVTYDFRGGKGVLSMFGALLIIDWRLMLALAAVTVALLLISRYMSLGSVTAAVLMPVGMWLSQRNVTVTVLAALSAALIVYMHRGNIDRLLHGTEAKLSLKK